MASRRPNSDADPDATATADRTETLSPLAAGYLEHTMPRAPAALTTESALVGLFDGRYRLGAELGRGGMGVVYEAHDTKLDRTVAIKQVECARGGATARARVRREAQVMARVEHDHVVRVHDVGAVGDAIYVVMERVRGDTLAAWMRERRPWREVRDRFVAAAHGLAAAHAVGVIHRDFKPANVLIDDRGRPRVTDFGVASLTSGDQPATLAPTGAETANLGLTQSGAIVGTPAYMAPEQFVGGAVDARSDQFSYCVALFEALHGVRPFAAAAHDDEAPFAALARAVRSGRITAASDSSVPAALDAIVRRGLAVDPTERWPSMTALAGELAAVGRRRRRWPLIAAALVSIAGLAAVLVGRHRDQATARPSFGRERIVRQLMRADRDRAVVPLADGRAVFVSRDGALELGRFDGDGERTPVPLPPGTRAIRAWPSAQPGAVQVRVSLGQACELLHVALDGRESERLGEDPLCERDMVAAPDGSHRAEVDGTKLVIVERASGRVVVERELGRSPSTLAWSPDGRRLAVILAGRKPGMIVDRSDGHAVALPKLDDAIWLDDQRVALAGGDGAIGTVLTQASVTRAGLVTDAAPLAHLPDAEVLALAVGPRGLVVHSRPRRRRIYRIPPASAARPLDELAPLETRATTELAAGHFATDGGVVLSLVGDEHALIEVGTGGPPAVVARHREPTALMAVAGTATLYTVRRDDGAVELHRWDAADRRRRLLRTVTRADLPLTLVCARGAERCLATLRGRAHWLDPRTGELIGPGPTRSSPVEHISPDGTTFAHVDDVLDRPIPSQELVLTSVADGTARRVPMVGADGIVGGPVWSADDQSLLALGWHDTERAPPDRVYRIGVDGRVTTVASSASMRFLAVTPASDGGVIVLASPADEDIRLLPRP